jgi:serine/threonine protein kinase
VRYAGNVSSGRIPPDVRPGRIIADKYRIERELGRGGFGVVVRAVHLTLDQPVAIKVLTEGVGTDSEWAVDAERFRREAQATAALRSEHVVRILDADVLEQGSPYIVMEYLEGETLHAATHLRGPLPIGEAVDHAIEVLAALGDAHAAGIVHRDLKPPNVFLSRADGGRTVVKVLDFGVSKMAYADEQPLTRTGTVIGTVAYMAPEQMMDAKRVDCRADLWSLGAILYEALSKHGPFGAAGSANVVTAILTRSTVPLSAVRPDIPPRLEAIVMRCLEKGPEHRFASAWELASALAEFATPRARHALEALRTTPRPSGAAAPAPPAPMRPSYLSVPPGAGGSWPRPGEAPGFAPPRPRRLGSGLALGGAAVVLGLLIGVGAGAVFLARSEWQAGAQVPAASPDAAPPTRARPSSRLPIATPVPAPSPEITSRPAASGDPGPPLPAASCDPPWVHDPEANIKRYKPECL